MPSSVGAMTWPRPSALASGQGITKPPDEGRSHCCTQWLPSAGPTTNQGKLRCRQLSMLREFQQSDIMKSGLFCCRHDTHMLTPEHPSKPICGIRGSVDPEAQPDAQSIRMQWNPSTATIGCEEVAL